MVLIPPERRKGCLVQFKGAVLPGQIESIPFKRSYRSSQPKQESASKGMEKQLLIYP